VSRRAVTGRSRGRPTPGPVELRAMQCSETTHHFSVRKAN
jgi:hypothetical protein